MKKISYILIGALLAIGTTVFAAPYFNYSKTIVPSTANEDLGTSTAKWRNIYTNQLCLSSDCKTAWPTGGGGSGSGTVSTSTVPTVGQLSYWTSNGFPSLLGSVATTTLTGTAPITFSQPISVLGNTPSVITCAKATGSVPGCISAADFTTFTNKVSSQWVDGGSGKLYYTGGSVGIGTTGPMALLHLYKSGSADPMLYMQGANQTDSLSMKIVHPNAVVGFALAGGAGAFMGTAAQDDAMLFGQSGKNLLFGLSGTEYMRINSSGNVGIGTMGPGVKLDVQGGAARIGTGYASGSAGDMSIQRESAVGQGYLYFGNSSSHYIGYDGTNFNLLGGGSKIGNGRTDIIANSETYALAVKYLDTAGRYYIGATNSSTPDLVFSNNLGTERVRIQDNGNVGIGTTAPGEKLEIAGNAKLSHIIGRTSSPTIATSTGIGTTGNASIIGTDLAGGINFQTGLTPATGSNILTVTFNVAYATRPFCTFSPTNANSALLSGITGIYATTTTTTLILVSGSSSLTASTDYSFSFHCVQ